MTSHSVRRLIPSLQDLAALRQEGGEVETLETHMSWVLLAGPHAYKIKKPVDLGFADFTTLASRRHFCEEELRINRRLAPQLYLDVVPICGTPEAPKLGESGEPIEYAVKMQRFPQQALLDRVLGRGELTGGHLDGLVRQIADFHGRVEVDRNGRGFGAPDAVRGPMEANFESLAQQAGNAAIAQRLESLRAWSREQFENRKHDFAGRKQNGFIRECHGDIHLGNMVLLDDSVVIFDAIEFNENLRWIDVQNDLAFPVMDLEDRGRADLARRTLSGYLEITGDYDGLAVMPYYLVYRALVRAKVVGIRLGQKSIAPEESERLEAELHGYLRLAEGYSAAPPPMLIITHGPAASGKTTGAARLVEQRGAVRIRSDVERKRLAGLDPLARTDSHLNEGLYTPESTRRCYGRLAKLAEKVVDAGFTAVVDAAFLHQQQRDLLADAAARRGVPFRILDFRADNETLRRRIARREAEATDASEADMRVLDYQLRSGEPLGQAEREASIIVHSDQAGWEEVLPEALAACAPKR